MAVTQATRHIGADIVIPLDQIPITQGRGNRSIQHTKTFGHGTELPKGGDASCVTSKQFKSVLRAASRKFVHSPLVTFICQPMAQAQQALMEVRGHLSQIVGSCYQAVHGILRVENQHIRLPLTKCQAIDIQCISFLKRILMSLVLDMQLHLLIQALNILHIRVEDKLTTIYHHIELATAGIAPRRQIRGEW